MKNLPEPDRSAARPTLELALSQYRYRGALCGYQGTAEEIDAVMALYDVYDAARGVANARLMGPALAADLKQAIHDAYDQTQKGRRLAGLRKKLLDSTLLCPVCGIDPPIELDHVLPRGDYKALAIYVCNLVPLCHQCNHRKLAGFAEPGQLGFVHIYFDTFPDVQFLRTEIELVASALSVTFLIDEDSIGGGDLGRRIGNIHTKLDLNNRYRADVNLYLTGHAIALHGAFKAHGHAGVRSLLTRQAGFETRRFYRNHWRPTLLNALAAHEEFCDGGFQAVFDVPEELLEDALG